MTKQSVPASSAPEAATVSRGAAAAALGIGERQLRKLVGTGRLRTVGVGHRARVDRASLDAELARREENRNSPRRKAELRRISTGAVPNFFGGSLADKTEPPQNVASMVVLTHGIPPGDDVELLSVAAAAARLGLSDRTLARAIALGQVPAIKLGDRYRVPASALRRLLSDIQAEARERDLAILKAK